MANTHWLTWAPGDTFSRLGLCRDDASKELPGTRITARLFDRAMNLIVTKDWTVNVPAGGAGPKRRKFLGRSRSTPGELFLPSGQCDR